MRSKAFKALKLTLVGWIIFTGLMGLQILANLMMHRPWWLILILVLPLPLLLYGLYAISLDLLRQDLRIERRRLVEKNEQYFKALSINGNARKYRVTREASLVMNEIGLHEDIELQFFRRTKVITHIRKWDERDPGRKTPAT